MKLFQCTVCAQVLFFENDHCTKCGHALAYLPDAATLTPLEPSPASGQTYRALSPALGDAPVVRVCKNYAMAACNWALSADDENEFCKSCRLSTIIPNLESPELADAWRRLEAAKRRLLYTLYGLGLPVEAKADAPDRGLAFAFKKDDSDMKVMTGHADGLITINVAEADDAFREKMRNKLGEGYRTLLGHFRHESGHYYWDRLVKGTDALASFRERFGDESASYEDAIQRHYEQGPPPDFRDRYVSAYAAMHPWEDFAETWAHYLHMVDTLETARAYRLTTRPAVNPPDSDLRLSTTRLDFTDFDDLSAAFIPLTLAINSLNRSMGLNDPYPFVLSQPALEKVRFVHELIEHGAKR
ncbi:MAG TPA: putative zinc-binding metallopeptidase [Polyangiaceae bacterium]|nr:putative zinc-binding metallopeptidase [Polyangiaceae bacterium]